MKYFKLIMNLLLYHHRTTLYTCFFRSTPKTLNTLYLTSVRTMQIQASRSLSLNRRRIPRLILKMWRVIFTDLEIYLTWRIAVKEVRLLDPILKAKSNRLPRILKLRKNLSQTDWTSKNFWKDDIKFVTEFPCLLGHPVALR